MNCSQFGIHNLERLASLQRQMEATTRAFQQPSNKSLKVTVARPNNGKSPAPTANKTTGSEPLSAREQLRLAGRFQLPPGGCNPAGRKVR